MKEKTVQQIKVVTAANGADLERKYNSAAEELAKYEITKSDIDLQKLSAYFLYNVNISQPETLEDDFSMHVNACHCSDCPFVQIGTDARRKWFPCPYAATGETRLDSPVCDTFYKEAVKRMREEAGR